MEVEHWKPIPGYHGYEVSDLGRVRSYRVKGNGGPNRLRTEPRLLKPTINGKGYPIVGPFRDGVSHVENVHKLVLLAFVGPRPDGLETLHGDGNKLNTRLDNLCYGTHRANTADNWRLGVYLAGARHPRAKLTQGDVNRIRELRANGESHRKIASQLHISHAQVGRIVRGESWLPPADSPALDITPILVPAVKQDKLPVTCIAGSNIGAALNSPAPLP